MKPYTVVMQIHRRGGQGRCVPSREVPVYAADAAEAIERATRVLEMDSVDCADPVSVTEDAPPRADGRGAKPLTPGAPELRGQDHRRRGGSGRSTSARTERAGGR